jgi:integral membrane protein (TIGR00529 family)
LSPSIVLLLSIASILVLLRLKLAPGTAVFVGSLVLSLLILPPIQTPTLILDTITGVGTLRLFAIIICSLTMSKLMEMKGLLLRLSHTLESVGPRVALHVVPTIIGLVPMPGGALVSATAIKELTGRLGLSPAQATYVNFWFRHLWEASAPVYPAVIAASVVLGVPLGTVVTTMLPSILLFALVGGAMSWRVLKGIPNERTHNLTAGAFLADLVRAAWPVLLLVGLVIGGLEAAFAFLIVVVLLAIQQHATRDDLWKALRYALGPRVLFLLFSVMLYKTIVEQSSAAYALFDDLTAMGVPPAFMLLTLPMLIAFATGLSIAFVGIAFPLLLPFMGSGADLSTTALFLAYVSGMVGYMASPLHLCLVLTVEYFQARLGDVYRLIVPPLVAVAVIVLVIYLAT